MNENYELLEGEEPISGNGKQIYEGEESEEIDCESDEEDEKFEHFDEKASLKNDGELIGSSKYSKCQFVCYQISFNRSVHCENLCV